MSFPPHSLLSFSNTTMSDARNLPMETLAKERANPPFDVYAMKLVNHDGEENLKYKEFVMLELERIPAFFNDDIYDLTKDELRVRTFIKIGRRLQASNVTTVLKLRHTEATVKVTAREHAL